MEEDIKRMYRQYDQIKNANKQALNDLSKKGEELKELTKKLTPEERAKVNRFNKRAMEFVKKGDTVGLLNLQKNFK